MIGSAHPTVEVDGFSGPFDLLARLVERRELDVLTISLATVTEQYLAHLETLRLRDPEHLSAFLVVAAKLLLIKSSLLLPSTPRRTAEGEPVADPTDLTERLRVYQVFRGSGQWLAAREDAGLRSYARPPSLYRPTHPSPPEPVDPSRLREALLRVNQRRVHQPDPTPVPGEPRLSVAEAMAMLRGALDQYTRVTFDDLVGDRATRQRCVAVFLAILEAIRLEIITAAQDSRFGAISLTPRQVAIDNDAMRRGR